MIPGWGQETIYIDCFLQDLPVSEHLKNNPLITDVFNNEYLSNELLDRIHSNNKNRTINLTLWDIDFNIKKDKERYLKRLVYLGFIDDTRVSLLNILWKPDNNTWDIWKASKIRLKPDECRVIVLPRQRLGNKNTYSYDIQKTLIEKEYCKLHGKNSYNKVFDRDKIKFGFLNGYDVSVKDILDKVDRERTLSYYKSVLNICT